MFACRHWAGSERTTERDGGQLDKDREYLGAKECDSALRVEQACSNDVYQSETDERRSAVMRGIGVNAVLYD